MDSASSAPEVDRQRRATASRGRGSVSGRGGDPCPDLEPEWVPCLGKATEFSAKVVDGATVVQPGRGSAQVREGGREFVDGEHRAADAGGHQQWQRRLGGGHEHCGGQQSRAAHRDDRRTQCRGDDATFYGAAARGRRIRHGDWPLPMNRRLHADASEPTSARRQAGRAADQRGQTPLGLGLASASAVPPVVPPEGTSCTFHHGLTTCARSIGFGTVGSWGSTTRTAHRARPSSEPRRPS